MGMLDGKVAIVTGAGAGLGRAHCHALAAEGATVVASNRVRDAGTQPSAEIVAQEIAAAGGTAIADTCAVEDWDALGALVQRTVADLGRLDIVVNNAGILVWDAICDIDEATYDELMAINVKGTFALTRHACAYWREAAARGEEIAGRIVNTTSGIALFGFPRGGLYGTSKGAVVSLTKVAAMEMRPYGVTANVIWPEARTRMGKGIFPEAPDEPGAFDPYHPENISPLVVYLGLRCRRLGHRSGLLRPGRPGAAHRRLVRRRRVPQRVGPQPRAVRAGQRHPPPAPRAASAAAGHEPSGRHAGHRSRAARLTALSPRRRPGCAASRCRRRRSRPRRRAAT